MIYSAIRLYIHYRDGPKIMDTGPSIIVQNVQMHRGMYVFSLLTLKFTNASYRVFL